MRRAPPRGRIYGRLPRAQACGGEREEERRGLREREPATRDRVGGGGVAQRLERGAEASEPDAPAPGDGAGYGRAPGQEQEDQQVAGRGVQLERMARRGPERREDDAPWERRRPPVAAAGEKAADAADGERHQPCRDERVEQLARRPPCHARDDERRSQACRDAT